MILHFNKTKDGKYITDKGMEIDYGLICAYPHDLFANGSGWVQVPTSFLTDGEVKIVGMHVGGATKSNKGLSIPAPSINHRPHIQLPETSLRQPSGSYMLNGETFTDEQLTEIRLKGFLVEPINIPEVMGNLDDEDLFQTLRDQTGTFTVNTEYLIGVLGLQARPNKNGSVHRWYHPSFGEDRSDNWLLFDLDSDPIQSLLPKIFRQGASLGTRVLKLQIKAAIEQH